MACGIVSDIANLCMSFIQRLLAKKRLQLREQAETILCAGQATTDTIL
jgi:hypothetical protein